MEIATLAFVCCFIPTYVAVRDKPRDVDIPFEVAAISIDGGDISLDPFFKRPTSFFVKVFVLKYLQPENYNIPVPSSWRSRRKQWVHWHRGDMTKRITNDNYLVRDYFSLLMAGCMVIGSTVFGGVHCLA